MSALPTARVFTHTEVATLFFGYVRFRLAVRAIAGGEGNPEELRARCAALVREYDGHTASMLEEVFGASERADNAADGPPVAQPWDTPASVHRLRQEWEHQRAAAGERRE